MEINSENGWVLPSGKYVECKYMGHSECAENELGKSEEELEKTAVKISIMPHEKRMLVEMITGSPPIAETFFLTRRKKMTRHQLNTIERYCIKFQVMPPYSFFEQKGWTDLYYLGKQEILKVLNK